MDRDTLVIERDLPAGRRLADALVKSGLPVKGVGWMHFDDPREWLFYVVTPAAETLGFRPVYQRVRDILETFGHGFPIDFMDIGVASDDDNLPARVVAAATGEEPIERVQGIGFVERTVPDAYVYHVSGDGREPVAA